MAPPIGLEHAASGDITRFPRKLPNFFGSSRGRGLGLWGRGLALSTIPVWADIKSSNPHNPTNRIGHNWEACVEWFIGTQNLSLGPEKNHKKGEFSLS